MSQSFPFALTHAWWTWEHPTIRAALRKAFLMHWVPVVESAFEQNKARGVGPKAWQELVGWERIRQDPRNVEKKTEGRYGCSEGFILGLSTALHIPLCKLYPSTNEYLEKAILSLLLARANPVAIKEYVQMRLGDLDQQNASAQPSLNGNRRAPPACKELMIHPPAVLELLMALEPKLAVIDNDLCERSSNNERNHERRISQPCARADLARTGL